MTQRSTWAAVNGSVSDKYGGSFLRAQQASPETTGDMSSLASINGTSTSASSGLAASFDSSHGLMAVGAVALVSFGLMAFATTVRVGHAEAHVGVGEV